METQIDAQSGAGDGAALAPPATALSAIAREDARILAELARAVEDDLARPDLAASTERAYAHDWADFTKHLSDVRIRRYNGLRYWRRQ